jgi:hypothetical protein
MFFIVPSVPTTVVMPPNTTSAGRISGVWAPNPPSPLPPRRCSCGSMNPGTTTRPAASITAQSGSSFSTALRSTLPAFRIDPPPTDAAYETLCRLSDPLLIPADWCGL